mmetsp:Transcript_63801/g.73372  ORF Transcript_63801/g.73372 Transcript_63801/m.73372 type:complete len:603 (+) Transcript_63801:313-2121(+)
MHFFFGTTAVGIIALVGLVGADPEKDRTLIIGGGLSGIHMGYRLKQRGQPAEIWEKSDVLGGKAIMLYEEEGATLDSGGQSLTTIAYREYFKLIEELDLKNMDDMKRFDDSFFIDPSVACFLANGLKECDITMISEEQYTIPMPSSSWYLGRGLILMQEEGYFLQFVQQTTLAGYDWTSSTFNLPELFVVTIINELEMYKNLLDPYTENAFGNPNDLSNPFNKYGFPKNTKAAKGYLNQSILEFFRENNIFFFRMFAEYYYSKQGYGLFEDTPLYYAAIWVSPQLVQYGLGVLTQMREPGNFDGWPYVIKRGMDGLLNLMVSKADLSVLFQRKVTKVKSINEGNRHYFEVYFEQVEYNNGKKKVTDGVERFDRVISGMSSQEFVQIYNKSREINQPFLCRHANTWAANVVTVSATTPAVSNVFDNKSAIFSGNLIVVDFLRMKDATEVSLNKDNRPVQVFYDLPSRKMSDHCGSDSEDSNSSASRYTILGKKGKSSKNKKNTKNKKKSTESKSYCPQVLDPREQLDDKFDDFFFGNAIIESVVATKITESYFPHSKDLYECDPWDVHNLQGNNGLYFIGGTVSFESCEHIIRYNNFILDTYL